MAITLNDLKERLDGIIMSIEQCDYGQARHRAYNLADTIQNAGITIHAVATIEDKKVVMDDSQEN